MEDRFHRRLQSRATTVCAIRSAIVGTPRILVPHPAFRYLHRPHRRREVRARGHPIPDPIQIVLQILLELLERTAVHTRRTLIGLHLLDRPPTPPASKYRTAFPPASARPSQLLPGMARLTERTQPRMTRPLRSTPITEGFITTMSRSASTPRNGTQRLTVSAACARSLSPPTRTDSVATCLPTFRAKAADRAHVASMPDTAWPVSGYPPDSSQEHALHPGFDASCTFTILHQRQQLSSSSRSPPDASRAPFPHRSPRQSSANAA